jgi:flagellar biosynthesis/type III secretory pathway chaperone
MRKKLFNIIISSFSLLAIGALVVLSSNKKSDFQSVTLYGDQEIEKAFIQYIARYGKSYSSKAEIPNRFQKFAKTYRMVQQHNSKNERSFEMEINQWADMLESDAPSKGGIKFDRDLIS